MWLTFWKDQARCLIECPIFSIVWLTFLIVSFHWTSSPCIFCKLQFKFRDLIILRLTFLARSIIHTIEHVILQPVIMSRLFHYRDVKFSHQEKVATTSFLHCKGTLSIITSRLWDGTWAPCDSIASRNLLPLYIYTHLIFESSFRFIATLSIKQGERSLDCMVRVCWALWENAKLSFKVAVTFCVPVSYEWGVLLHHILARTRPCQCPALQSFQ